MPTPTRKTNQRIERMIAMHKAGASAREIGEELGIHHATVARWLRDAGLDPNGGQGPRERRKRPTPEGAAAVIAEAVADVAEINAVTGPVAPRTRAEAFARLQARLQQIGQLADGLAQGMKTGTTHGPTLAAVVKLEQDLAEGLEALAPPPELDPNDDPTNIEMAATVEGRLQQLVEAAERVFQCANCGCDPYRKVG